MDVTFRESEPYYGEKTGLSSLFELSSDSCSSENYREGENDINVVEGKEDNQSRRTEIITGSIPYAVSNLHGNDMQNSMGIENIRARQEEGSLRVYTRRKRTTELQPVERQAEYTQFEL